MTIYIGIDLGTTALKAAAFRAGERGAAATASRRLPVRTAADGAREQDPAMIRDALRDVCAELRAQLRDDWSQVAGIGLAAQGGSCVMAHRETGACGTPMILWNDSRPHAYMAEIAAQCPVDYWQQLSRRDFPGHGLPRFLWLRRTFPNLFTPDYLAAGAGDYAFFQLTGEWRQDACNALQTGCYNVPEDRLDADALALAGVSPEIVPPLRRGHEMHGLSATGAALTGLPAGLPVAGPYMDHEAGYLSAAGISARPLQCSLGTAWVGNFVVSDDIGGSPVQLVIPNPAGDGQLVIQPLLTGNVSWDWGLETFVSADHAEALRQLDGIFRDALLPPAGVYGLPWLTQSNPLVANALGAGAFIGLNVHTGRHDMLRALAAGLVSEFYRILATVKDAGIVDSVVLGGGASKGFFFRDMLAALFAPLPVYSLEDEDLAGTRGTLYAFDRDIAQAHPRPAAAPVGEVSEQIMTYTAGYRDVFQKLYGHVTMAAPYVLS